MKNFIELKTNSIHPIYTPNGWIQVVLPVSIVACFLFYFDPNDPEGGCCHETSLCLN
ncbi:MAG: hypothetical protein ABIN89_06110 [Chitinophagaceae bacterium]